MEFKLNGTAEEALRQIEEKGYALPFAGDDREVFKIGVNFSSETRNIEKWLGGGKSHVFIQIYLLCRYSIYPMPGEDILQVASKYISPPKGSSSE